MPRSRPIDFKLRLSREEHDALKSHAEWMRSTPTDVLRNHIMNVVREENARRLVRTIKRILTVRCIARVEIRHLMKGKEARVGELDKDQLGGKDVSERTIAGDILDCVRGDADCLLGANRYVALFYDEHDRIQGRTFLDVHT